MHTAGASDFIEQMFLTIYRIVLWIVVFTFATLFVGGHFYFSDLVLLPVAQLVFWSALLIVSPWRIYWNYKNYARFIEKNIKQSAPLLLLDDEQKER